MGHREGDNILKNFPALNSSISHRLQSRRGPSQGAAVGCRSAPFSDPAGAIIAHPAPLGYGKYKIAGISAPASNSARTDATVLSSTLAIAAVALLDRSDSGGNGFHQASRLHLRADISNGRLSGGLPTPRYVFPHIDVRKLRTCLRIGHWSRSFRPRAGRALPSVPTVLFNWRISPVASASARTAATVWWLTPARAAIPPRPEGRGFSRRAR